MHKIKNRLILRENLVYYLRLIIMFRDWARVLLNNAAFHTNTLQSLDVCYRDPFIVNIQYHPTH